MKILRYVAVSGALLFLGAALDHMYARRCRQRVDTRLDEALDGTFPASDPPATQDFSSPAERERLRRRATARA